MSTLDQSFSLRLMDLQFTSRKTMPIWCKQQFVVPGLIASAAVACGSGAGAHAALAAAPARLLVPCASAASLSGALPSARRWVGHGCSGSSGGRALPRSWPLAVWLRQSITQNGSFGGVRERWKLG